MPYLYLLNFKLTFLSIIQIRKIIPFWRIHGLLFLYPFFLINITDDNRTIQIIRIIKMFYMLSTNSMGVSISELLLQLGVCERTIYRDLDRLEYAGIPLVRENHRIKLIETTSTACLSKHIKGVMMNEELRIKTKPGKLYDVAHALVSSLDSIQSIEPKNLEKWLYSEAKRRGKDIKV